MKALSTIMMALCSSSMLAGCATNSTNGSSEVLSPTLQAIIDTAQSLYKRGRELHRASRLAEADQYYQQALKIEPSHMDAQNALAALDASRGDVDRAIRLLSSLAEAHPEAAHIHANLGYAYYLKGHYVLAQESLERATMLDPTNENSWKKLDIVVAEINRREQLTHSAAANQTPAQQDDAAIEISAVMPGVYSLRYPENYVPAQTVVLEPVKPPPAAVVSLAVLPPASSSPLAAPAGRVELVNGNGVTGLARALRGLIAEQQWKVVRTRNNEQYTVKATRIEYAYSYYPAARQLAETMGVSAVLRPNNQQDGSNLRVVLGHDYTSVEPMRQRVAGLPLSNVN